MFGGRGAGRFGQIPAAHLQNQRLRLLDERLAHNRVGYITASYLTVTPASSMAVGAVSEGWDNKEKTV